MSHSIYESRCKNPMWYFERNYVLLHKCFWRMFDSGESQECELSKTRIICKVIERTKYTDLVDVCQVFPQSNVLIPNLVFKVRIYHDARLAEVISYQGYQHVQARYEYPNGQGFYPDEKRQANLLFYEWLLNYMRKARSLLTTVS